CDSLRKLLPAADAPHLWREYLDRLLRYEQLLRAGDETSAAAMKAEAERLRKKVVDAGRLHLDSVAKPESLQATLTMPAALGYGLEPRESERLRQDLDKLWNASEAVPDEKYRELTQ